MLVKNLRLNFDRVDNEKMFLRTENGLEISLPENLLDQYSDRQQPIYLNIDYQPNTAAEINQKQILNELLDR